tara:strand:- start:118 stop:834 length:717 start_codon:yes stop_codon:yes gene_type:complete
MNDYLIEQFRLAHKLDEDFECWEEYPQHRWVFNKLDVAMKLGYQCGPACVPVQQNGNYIVRPIYNLYGMSVSAEQKYLRVEDAHQMHNHKHIPPGHFWCEWFDGDHYSIDYAWHNNVLEPTTTTVGTKEGLKFTQWTKIANVDKKLPEWFDHFDDVEELNVEFIGDKLIEVHLRSGNDIVHDDPVGTKMIPHWQDSDPDFINMLKERWTYHNNYCDDDPYDASGYIDNPRLGYLKLLG